MSMNIDTTRFAAAHPVAEVDFGQQRKEQMKTHEAIATQLHAQKFAADYAAHVAAAESRLRLNVRA